MFVRNIRSVSKSLGVKLYKNNAYLVELQQRSKSDSHKAFRSMDSSGEILSDQSANKNASLPKRGPTTGPGPSDKTTPDEALQMDDEWMKTNIQLDSTKLKNYMLLSVDQVLHMGFVISGKQLMGKPIAMLPDTVLWWNVRTVKDITAESLALFYTCHPPLEIVIIGTGNKMEFIDPREIEKLHKRGLKVDVMSTDKAAGTYNLLRNDRRVGLAMLPSEREDEAEDLKWEKEGMLRNRSSAENLEKVYEKDDHWNLSAASRRRIANLPKPMQLPYMKDKGEKLTPMQKLERRKYLNTTVVGNHDKDDE